MRTTRAAFGVLVLVLLAGSVQAQDGLSFGPAGGSYEERPNTLVKCEVLSLGYSYPYGANAQLLRVTATAWGVRVGASLAESYGPMFINGGALLPVHVGYTFFSEPHKVLFFYNLVPEAYVEVSTAFWATGMVPFVRGSVYGGAEAYGVGVGLEAGVMSSAWDDAPDPHVQGPIRRWTSPYVAFRVKLPAVSVGF